MLFCPDMYGSLVPTYPLPEVPYYSNVHAEIINNNAQTVDNQLFYLDYKVTGRADWGGLWDDLKDIVTFPFSLFSAGAAAILIMITRKRRAVRVRKMPENPASDSILDKDQLESPSILELSPTAGGTLEIGTQYVEASA